MNTIAVTFIALAMRISGHADASVEWQRYCAEPTPENARRVMTVNPEKADWGEIDEGLSVLETEVMCGDAEAIRLAYRLMQEADGAYSEVLHTIVGRLIRIDATLFLKELQNHPDQVERALDSILGGLGVSYADRFQAQRYELTKRLDAIRHVMSPELGLLQARCARELEEQIAQVEGAIASGNEFE